MEQEISSKPYMIITCEYLLTRKRWERLKLSNVSSCRVISESSQPWISKLQTTGIILKIGGAYDGIPD
jgi:hypothetical protein